MKKKSKKSTISNGSDGLLQDILSELQGDGDAAQLLGSEGLAIKIRGVIPTSCASIDAAIGRGGIPLGRLIVVYGKEGCGKTSFALSVVAECQRLDGIAIYLDVEYKLDPDYARNIGVNTEKLIIVQPSYLERTFDYITRVIDKVAEARTKTGNRTPVLIVLDSINASITKSQYKGEWEDIHVAPQSRVYSALLPKLIPKVSKEDVALLFIGQIRQKINVQFGESESLSGGNAVKFYSSLIMKMTKLSSTKEDDVKVSNRTRLECVKNQISAPFKKAEFDIVYGEGIDGASGLLWLAEQNKVIVKSGSYFAFGDEKLGQGRKTVIDMLKSDQELRDEILAEIEKKKRKHKNGDV